MNLRVAVVEDEPLMRLAIASAVRLARLEVVFEAGSGAHAVELAKQRPVDAAILDLHLGEGPTGLDVARFLRLQNPNVGLVFLTSFEDPRLLSTTLPQIPHNAQYLTKGTLTDTDVLLSALAKSLSNLPRSRSEEKSSPVGKLTDNQLEILRMVAEGLSNAEISKRRFVTERSIEVAISRIAKALNMVIDSSSNQRVHIANVYFRAIGKPLK